MPWIMLRMTIQKRGWQGVVGGGGGVRPLVYSMSGASAECTRQRIQWIAVHSNDKGNRAHHLKHLEEPCVRKCSKLF